MNEETPEAADAPDPLNPLADCIDEPDPFDPPGYVRYGFDELTGLPVINARPGARRVTTEQIREWLKDFP